VRKDSAILRNTRPSRSTFLKIQNLLKAQACMGDIVMMRAHMTSDPAMEGKLDFAGMNAAYAFRRRAAEQARQVHRAGRRPRGRRGVRRDRGAGGSQQMKGQAMAMSRAFLVAFAASASATALVTSGEVLIAGRQAAPAPSVFTVQQATAGSRLRHIAPRAMPDLSGNGKSALAGPTFMETWGSRTTEQFFDYISAAMPYGQPSLTTEAYTEITAFILQSNGAVAGETALSASTAVIIGDLVAAH
jgi:hypothetical protein